MRFGHTSLAAVLAGGDVGRAILGHVFALAVVALHRLGALLDHVRAGATRTDKGLGAVSDEVALLATVAAAHGRLVGTVLGNMALLLAVTAFACESDRVWAVGLVVSAGGGSVMYLLHFLRNMAISHTRPRRS